MKQIGSLLTAGALALSLVTLPAGAAEAAPALEETAQAAAQAALTAGAYGAACVGAVADHIPGIELMPAKWILVAPDITGNNVCIGKIFCYQA